MPRTKTRAHCKNSQTKKFYNMGPWSSSLPSLKKCPFLSWVLQCTLLRLSNRHFERVPKCSSLTKITLYRLWDTKHFPLVYTLNIATLQEVRFTIIRYLYDRKYCLQEHKSCLSYERKLCLYYKLCYGNKFKIATMFIEQATVSAILNLPGSKWNLYHIRHALTISKETRQC